MRGGTGTSSKISARWMSKRPSTLNSARPCASKARARPSISRSPSSSSIASAYGDVRLGNDGCETGEGEPFSRKVPLPFQAPPLPLQRISCLLNPWSQRSLGIDLGRHTCRKEGVSEGTGEAFSKKRKPGNRIARLLCICNRSLLSSACPVFIVLLSPLKKVTRKPQTGIR